MYFSTLDFIICEVIECACCCDSRWFFKRYAQFSPIRWVIKWRFMQKRRHTYIPSRVARRSGLISWLFVCVCYCLLCTRGRDTYYIQSQLNKIGNTRQYDGWSIQWENSKCWLCFFALPSVEWHGSMYNYCHIQYIYALIVTSWYAFVVASAAAAKWTAFIIQAHPWVSLLLKQKSQKPIAHRMCILRFQNKFANWANCSIVMDFVFVLSESVSRTVIQFLEFRNCIHTNFCDSFEQIHSHTTHQFAYE